MKDSGEGSKAITSNQTKHNKFSKTINKMKKEITKKLKTTTQQQKTKQNPKQTRNPTKQKNPIQETTTHQAALVGIKKKKFHFYSSLDSSSSLPILKAGTMATQSLSIYSERHIAQTHKG